MRNYVYCSKDPSHYELIHFYLTFEGETYYLFTQHYSNTAYSRFRKPVPIETALKFQKGLQLRSFNAKLPKYIKYIEDCEGITVLKKTEKRKSGRYKVCAAV